MLEFGTALGYTTCWSTRTGADVTTVEGDADHVGSLKQAVRFVLIGLGGLMRRSAPSLLERRMYAHGGWSGRRLWLHPDYDLCFIFMTYVIDAHL